MSVGPKELERRKMREARAGGVTVKDRPSKAGAKINAGGGRAPPGKPPEVAMSGNGPETFTFLVKAPVEFRARAERERAKRGLRDRNAAIVAVLDEGLAK